MHLCGRSQDTIGFCRPQPLTPGPYGPLIPIWILNVSIDLRPSTRHRQRCVECPMAMSKSNITKIEEVIVMTVAYHQPAFNDSSKSYQIYYIGSRPKAPPQGSDPIFCLLFVLYRVLMRRSDTSSNETAPLIAYTLVMRHLQHSLSYTRYPTTMCTKDVHPFTSK